MNLILASQSPRRRELLGLFRLPFTVRVADIDETMDLEKAPYDEVARVSRLKAEAIQRGADDVETVDFGKKFDAIMVYNAFPHFPEPEKLIANLSGLLNFGGTLTVAHGMSRAAIDRHHEGIASKVSVGLMHEDALEKLFAKHLTVTVKISNDRMYQVTGKKL